MSSYFLNPFPPFRSYWRIIRCTELFGRLPNYSVGYRIIRWLRKLGPAPSVGFFEKTARERWERVSVEHAKSFECFVCFASKWQALIFGSPTELFGTELFSPPTHKLIISHASLWVQFDFQPRRSRITRWEYYLGLFHLLAEVFLQPDSVLVSS